MNHSIIDPILSVLDTHGLTFSTPPVLVGGRAMEFYGLRPSGEDIDLIVEEADYKTLAKAHPEQRKDIWGDLDVILWPLEIWRSIMYFDHSFYAEDAADCGDFLVVSPEKLLLTRVYAMDNEKYAADLLLLRQYMLNTHANPAYLAHSHAREAIYLKHPGGVIWAGKD